MQRVRWGLARGVIVVGVSALFLAACGGAQSRYSRYLARSEQYLSQGQLDKARVEIRSALQIQPKAPDALYVGGRIAELRGDLRGAGGFYQAAIDARPDFPDAVAGLAGVYVTVGAPERADKLLATALAKHPDMATLLAVRAAARLGLKDTAGARSDAERTLQLDPSNERAIGLLAGLDRAAGDLPGALKLVRAAIKARPDSVNLHQLLVALYLDGDDFDAGRQELLALIKLKPGELAYRYQLAELLARSQRLDEAQGVLEDCVRAAPQSDQPKLALVDFLASRRSPELAEAGLRDFIAGAPRDYDLRLALGALLQQRRAYGDASRVYADLAALDEDGPHGLTARDRMAELEAAQGNFPVAEKLIAETLKRNSHDLDALTLRGTLELQQLSDPTSAIADLRTVLRDRPQAVALRRLLAQAYLENGEASMAEESLRAALEANPRDGTTIAELAALLTRANRTEEAVTVLEEAVRRSPNDPLVRESLGRVYLGKGDVTAARRAADDLKTLSPKSASGFYLSGLVAQAEKKPDESEREFERALALEPGATEPLSALTLLEMRHGHSRQAIERVQGAAARDPSNPQLVNLLAELYFTEKDFAKAAETLNHAIALAPNWAVPYRNLARLQLAQDDVATAIRTYETGVEHSAADAQLVNELAALYEKQGRSSEAIMRLTELHKQRPGQPWIARNLAMLLVTYRSDRASLDTARDLTAPFSVSQNSLLLDVNGWVRFKRGEFTDARATLERAASLTPTSSEIRYHLAMAQLRTGDTERARDNLEQALAGAGRFSGAREARAALASLRESTG